MQELISMKGLLGFVLKKWKAIVAVILIGSIIGCTYYYFLETYSEQEMIDNREYVYNQEIIIDIPLPKTEDEAATYDSIVSLLDGAVSNNVTKASVYVTTEAPIVIAPSIDKHPTYKNLPIEEKFKNSFSTSVFGPTAVISFVSTSPELAKKNVEIFIETVTEYLSNYIDDYEIITKPGNAYTVNDIEVITSSFSKIDMLKKGATFGAVFFILVIVILILIYLFGNTLRGGDELLSGYTVPLIGVLSCSKRNADHQLLMARENLKQLMTKGEIQKVIFTSSCRKKFDFSKYVSALCKIEVLNITGTAVADEWASNAHTEAFAFLDPAANPEDFYSICRKADGIVLIERQDATNRKALQTAVYNLELQDVNLLAFWLLNV